MVLRSREYFPLIGAANMVNDWRLARSVAARLNSLDLHSVCGWPTDAKDATYQCLPPLI